MPVFLPWLLLPSHQFPLAPAAAQHLAGVMDASVQHLPPLPSLLPGLSHFVSNTASEEATSKVAVKSVLKVNSFIQHGQRQSREHLRKTCCNDKRSGMYSAMKLAHWHLEKQFGLGEPLFNVLCPFLAINPSSQKRKVQMQAVRRRRGLGNFSFCFSPN